MNRRAFFSLFGFRGIAAQTRLTNDRLPQKLEVETITTAGDADDLYPGGISMGGALDEATPPKVDAGSIRLSAPVVVTEAYTLVHPPGPPQPGQAGNLVWSQPANGVVTGSWQ